MKTDDLLHQILPILYTVKEDEEKLQQILDFLLDEIYEKPDDEIVIPEKYKELVKNIAQSIDCGMVCYINPDNLEMEEVPSTLVNDPHEYEMLTGLGEKDMNLNYKKWKKRISVEPPESRESFGIMERFANQVEDKNLQRKLIQALSNRKPFANFKFLVDNSDCREDWFAFKQKQLEEYVWQDLSFEFGKYKLI